MTNFKLVVKFTGPAMSVMHVGIVRDGMSKEIMSCLLPMDHQLSDNVAFAEEIKRVCNKRLRNSTLP